MEFKRKKKRGVNRKVYRIWLSREGYRITWRKEVFGVSVPTRFQACVRTLVPGNFEAGYTEMWDFVNNSRRLYKTMKAAVADCERHARLWSRIVRCTGIRAVRELFGREPREVPKWASTVMDRRIFEMLMDTRPRRKSDEDEEEPAELSTEPEAPVKKKRKPRSDKGSSRKQVASDSGKKKRKPRSDKGKPRGPRKPKGTL